MLVTNFDFVFGGFLDKLTSKGYVKILYIALQAWICNFLHTNIYFVSSVSNWKLFRKILQGNQVQFVVKVTSHWTLRR